MASRLQSDRTRLACESTLLTRREFASRRDKRGRRESWSADDQYTTQARVAASRIAVANKRAAIRRWNLQTISDATPHSQHIESVIQEAAKAGPQQRLRTAPSARDEKYPSTSHQSRCDAS